MGYMFCVAVHCRIRLCVAICCYVLLCILAYVISCDVLLHIAVVYAYSQGGCSARILVSIWGVWGPRRRPQATRRSAGICTGKPKHAAEGTQQWFCMCALSRYHCVLS